MHRRMIGWLLVSLCAGQMSRAQELRLWNRTVQVHGFASQGFVYTDENNWLTMNTSQGSAAMTDMGLNLSSQLTDKFRIGAQVYDRNLGRLGQWHPSLDWALGDYRFTNWFGIRAGKVKTTMGLYNDSQDLDFLHVFALLPQGVYPTDLRDTTIAHTGGDIYGNVPLHHRLGDISYTAFVGHRSDSIYSGYPYLISQWGVYFHSLGGLQYGGDVRWNTPVKGVLIGTSRMNEEITGKGQVGNPSNASAGLQPYQVTAKTCWTNQFYGEYLIQRLRIDAEYRRKVIGVPYGGGSNVTDDVRGWYVAGSYRILRKVQVGTYYSHYTMTNAVAGPIQAVFPAQTDTSVPANHIYDKVISGRVDLNRFWNVKIEGHFMDGYGTGPYPNGFYPQVNPTGFKPNTNALILKTGFHF